MISGTIRPINSAVLVDRSLSFGMTPETVTPMRDSIIMKVLIKIPVIAMIGGAFLFSGCGEKEATVETPSVVAEDADSSSAAEPAQAAADSSGSSSQWSTYNAALEKDDYEKAADSLMKMQFQSGGQASVEQGLEQINKMRELSKVIADRAASGDPSAMRAAAMMQQIGRAHV